ncbi:parB-like nuclease domain protein [Planomonospora sphaerica]|uniref:ParB-like nuclease domain protein n=1 Tax=Planomonospora sphaerica TaxID=161355 RepID=A0A171DE45_9ACTN|nr:ParB N-terminal domain-containing protein [Planomonospora sphaerica]GAT68110.1 parB-like nuclease domain protein [Planomonospora sphaerica]
MSALANLRAVRRRSRVVLRRLTGPSPSHALMSAAKSLPIPAKVRVQLSTALLRQRGSVTVPIDRLLLGAQNGWTATKFSTGTGDMLWGSTPVSEGPHVALLRLADGREPSDEEILDSPYGTLARRAVATGGRYFWATDDAGIVETARAFIDRHRGGAPQAPRTYQSGPDDPILVAPVKWSGYYQVLDGHHRLASAVQRGERSAEVTVKRFPVTTPLQDHLLRMSWLDGTRELYQPIDAPELAESWPTVRKCTDRRDKMREFLGDPAGLSYLDVASCYGWFVSEMGRLGMDAHGVERDPLAVPLGQAVYGLPAGAIETGDCVEILGTADRTWDVVSCFSLLHHFVLGRASVGPEDLLRLLDRVTGRVLFLDTGQENEAWFRTSLAGWNPSMIADFLRRNTTFSKIVDLGPDDDAVPPYADNYRRHLFACVREDR